MVDSTNDDVFDPTDFGSDASAEAEGSEMPSKVIPGLKLLVARAHGIAYEERRSALATGLKARLNSDKVEISTKASTTLITTLVKDCLLKGWNRKVKLNGEVCTTPHPKLSGWFYKTDAAKALLDLNHDLANEIFEYAMKPSNYTKAANQLDEADKSLA